MGTRVDILVVNAEGQTVATLCVNTSHEAVDIDAIVTAIAQISSGPTSFVRFMLEERYMSRSADGRHGSQDRMFAIGLYLDDRDYVIQVAENPETTGPRLLVERLPA